MRHKAHVLIAAILVLAYAATVTAQSTEIKRETGAERRTRLLAAARSTEIKQLRVKAEQGDANAQNSLGWMYNWGKGIAQNFQEAVKWYRLAAEQGYASAQANLGVMYSNGKGVPQDHQEALKWYRLAAEQWNVGAQFNLGLMYDRGEGVPQDYVQAHKWYNLAASRATAGETDDLRSLRDALAKKMTASQVADAQRLARKWKLKTWEQLKGE